MWTFLEIGQENGPTTFWCTQMRVREEKVGILGLTPSDTRWKGTIWRVALFNNLTFTSTQTRILYGTYGIYRPICYCTHICSVMGKSYHVVHMGWICLDVTVHMFARKWVTSTILQDTVLIFPGCILRIYVDLTDCCKYIMDCYDQRTQTCDYDINVSFHIMRATLFRHLIGVNFL